MNNPGAESFTRRVSWGAAAAAAVAAAAVIGGPYHGDSCPRRLAALAGVD